MTHLGTTTDAAASCREADLGFKDGACVERKTILLGLPLAAWNERENAKDEGQKPHESTVFCEQGPPIISLFPTAKVHLR